MMTIWGYTGKYMRVAPAGHNEAPAIFKRRNVLDDYFGLYPVGHPMRRVCSRLRLSGDRGQTSQSVYGENAKITYGGQSTYILTLQGEPNKYIFMADIWRPKNPIDARYIWLPVQFDDKGVPFLKWIDE